MNIRTDRMWDLSQPVTHDGPAWAEYDPPVITHNYRRALLSAGKVIIEDLRVAEVLLGRRCFFTAFPVLLEGCGDAWTRAVAWELE